MSVPKSRRKISRFETSHSLFRLRDEVTKLTLNDFGFSEKKYEKSIARFCEQFKDKDNTEEIVERMRNKQKNYIEWFIREESRAILGIVRRIEEEFNVANSIYPSETPAKLLEFFTRRWHMNKAIGLCYALKQEIHYVLRTLPVDVNKYERFAEAIDAQIALFKGVRKSDNRFVKSKKADENENKIKTLLDNVAALFYQIGER